MRGKLDSFRLAYLYHWDTHRPDGVTKKIQMQLALWRDMGVKVNGYSICPARNPEDPQGEGDSVEQSFRYSESIRDRILATRRACQAIAASAPHLLYLRYTPLLPPPIRLMRRVPTVIEVNSDDRAEYRFRGRLKAQYNRSARSTIAHLAAGVVGVTPTLTRQFSSSAPHALAETISNGVRLSDTLDERRPVLGRPRLVFMGSGDAPWHGVDKIPRLAESLPAFDFDVIGGQLPAGMALPGNVVSHPFLSTADYRQLLDRAHVGIGPLALHRNGMTEAAPLKVREYLSRGLPVALAYNDPDFADEPWYTAQLPNTESVAALVEPLRDFVKRVAGRRVGSSDLRSRIDATEKERRRLEFLLEVQSRRTASS